MLNKSNSNVFYGIEESSDINLSPPAAGSFGSEKILPGQRSRFLDKLRSSTNNEPIYANVGDILGCEPDKFVPAACGSASKTKESIVAEIGETKDVVESSLGLTASNIITTNKVRYLKKVVSKKNYYLGDICNISLVLIEILCIK